MSQPHDASWVDRQIREAQERGEFDNLPGAGKPLKNLERDDPDWWVRGLIRRENLDMSAALPPALALRKEARGLVNSAMMLTSEEAVRLVVEDFNDRLRAALRRPAEGPPIAVRTFDVDEVVSTWWSRRAALATEAAARRTAEAEAAPPPRRRRRLPWSRHGR